MPWKSNNAVWARFWVSAGVCSVIRNLSAWTAAKQQVCARERAIEEASVE